MNILNKTQALELISQDPGAWAFEKHIKTNKLIIEDMEVAKECLKKNGTLLNYCSEAFKNNYDLVIIAVTNNGMALDYASQDLKDNDGIVKIAMKLNQAIAFASPRIKDDKEFALRSLMYNPNDIRFYSKEIQEICGDGGSSKARNIQRQNLERAINSEKLSHQLEQDLEVKPKTAKVKI
jgi:Domain of unknown function (DUF4116)